MTAGVAGYLIALEQLANMELICNGTGIHWPALDEDLSVQGNIEGRLGAA